MANAPIVEIGITFRDRDGAKGRMTFSTPWNLTIADIWLLANRLADRASALSNAPLYRIDLLYRWRPDDQPEAPASSDVSRKLLLLITNAQQEINGMIIPSTRDVFESTGSYAGIRADLLHPAIVQFGELLLSIPFQTEDGRDLGATIAAAGLTL